jgi:predicted ribosome quality control (RQC) complex YloA/Tae2 family protein
MHFDALTLACVCHELKQVVLTGRIQQVLMPDEQSISLEIYAQRQRHYLLLCTHPQQARVHLASQKQRRGAEQPTPLLLLLRKYVRDSLLVGITQPDPTERLLQLAFEHAQHGPTTLVVEIIGQRSNLLLLNPAGKIMDCLQRVRPSDPTQRLLLPGQPYILPPRQTKLAPVDDGSPDYYAQLEAVTRQPGKLWKVLTANLAGLSPTLGREIAWRATGDGESATSAVNFLELVQTLQTLWAPVQTGEWQPGGWVEDSGQGDKVTRRQGERGTGREDGWVFGLRGAWAGGVCAGGFDFPGGGTILHPAPSRAACGAARSLHWDAYDGGRGGAAGAAAGGTATGSPGR